MYIQYDDNAIGDSCTASTDTNSLKHFGIEIRTALNYQTECIRRELSNLTKVSICVVITLVLYRNAYSLSDTSTVASPYLTYFLQVLFSQHSSSASSFIEQASHQFGELGVLKLDLEKLVKEMNVAKDRIDYLFRDQIELRTSFKTFKKDYKHMKTENEHFKQKILALESNYGVYFDAYR